MGGGSPDVRFQALLPGETCLYAFPCRVSGGFRWQSYSDHDGGSDD